MSLVFGFATTKSAIIVSDGRAIRGSDNSILTENCNKTKQINKNVIIGFSGELEISESIIHSFTSNYKEQLPQLKSDNVANILCNLYQSECNHRYSLDIPVHTKFQMIVSGITSENKIGMYSFGVPTNFKITAMYPTPQEHKFTILSPENVDAEFIFQNALSTFPDQPLDTYIMLLFAKVSNIDNSVNTNLFKQVVSI